MYFEVMCITILRVGRVACKYLNEQINSPVSVKVEKPAIRVRQYRGIWGTQLSEQ